MKIGLFDSGVGGLSVLQQLQAGSGRLAGPAETLECFYLADTARCPYGNRSKQEISQFVSEIITFLNSLNLDHIIMACNTSAALALDTATQLALPPIHDLISPTAKYVAGRFSKVVVLATKSTVSSKAFSSAIQKYSQNVSVTEIACPDLVPLVESGQIDNNNAREALTKYVEQINTADAEAVILGCTHFPFFKPLLADMLGPTKEMIDPARLIVEALSGQKAGGAAKAVKSNYYVTGNTNSFKDVANLCLHQSGLSIKAEEIQSILLTGVLDAKKNEKLSRAEMMPAPAPSL